jgi:putative ABC transport system permease protein
MNGPVPILSSSQADAVRRQVDALAADLHATSVLPLTGAVNPDGPASREGRPPVILGKPHGTSGDLQYRGNEMIPVFVATPELLAHYGIDPASINAGTDLLTPRASLAGYDLVSSGARNWHPTLQRVTLSTYSSLPNVLLTTSGMTRNRMRRPVASRPRRG